MNQKMPYFGLHDPTHLVCLSRNRMYVNLMNLESGDCVTTFKAGEDRFLNSLLVSGDGRWVNQLPSPVSSFNSVRFQNLGVRWWDAKTFPTSCVAFDSTKAALRPENSSSWREFIAHKSESHLFALFMTFLPLFAVHNFAVGDYPRRILRVRRCQGAGRAIPKLHCRLRSTKWHSVQEVEAFMQHRLVGDFASQHLRHCWPRRRSNSNLGFGDRKLSLLVDR